MKKIEIFIGKTEILDKVSLASAYAGAKTDGDDSAYERVATIDADKELLEGFRSEICGIITEKLRDFIEMVTNSEDGVTLNLSVSNAYDDALTPSIIEDLSGAFVSGICGRWFRFTFPEKSVEWLNQSAELLNRACSKLCYRKKPVRFRV